MENSKLFLATVFLLCSQAHAQQRDSVAQIKKTPVLTASEKPEATEFYEPIPPVVTPADNAAYPPSDAIVLFDGKNLDQWVSSNDTTQSSKWILTNGFVTVNKKAGDIQTKDKLVDFQLHIEYRIPADITGSGQARGNSGIFLASPAGQGGYELQVLDNYNNSTYVNGQVGSIYKQAVPLANACRKPGEWQTFDVVWTAPRFNDHRILQSPARATVFHNGVLVQNNTTLLGQTPYIGQPSYKLHGAAPIRLQAHGDPSEPISYRNIWVRKL